MQTINAREARAQISRLLDAVEAGEEIIIQRNGKPIARLAPIDAPETSAHFPDRRAFRKQFPASRKDSGDFVRELRDDERF
jgi:prevent-host-death family protein